MFIHRTLPALLLLLLGGRATAVDSIVVFNEIQYHPLPGALGGEWVELHNQMAIDMDISAWSIKAAARFSFPEGTIVPAGGYLVVADYPSALQAATGLSGILGPLTGQLANSGDRLELRDRNDRLMDEITYDDHGLWPVAADGSGATLAKGDPDSASNVPANWRSSVVIGGTPGARNFPETPVVARSLLSLDGQWLFNASSADPGMVFGASLAATVTPVGVESMTPDSLVINEISGASGGTLKIELVNRGPTPMETGGYVLKRTGASPDARFTFPSGYLPPGGLLSLTQGQIGFGAVTGDRLFLLRPGETAVGDAVEIQDEPLARWPDGTGGFLKPSFQSFGLSNAVSLHDAVVINEIMYHAPPTLEQPAEGGNPAVPFSRNPEQWIELFNRSSKPVDLTGWQFDEGVDFRFPDGTILAPGGYCVVASDPAALSAKFPGLSPLGPFGGRLSHKGGRIVLRDSNGNPADIVPYSTDWRWPETPDGGGSSLELRDPRADNALGESWAASDERGRTSWKTYVYEGMASASPVGPDSQWNEFVIGLLDKGEVLLDDISVIESPGTTALQLLQNGTFETGASHWRIIGNHHGTVVDDPDQPGNKVLRLVATGSTDHMSNHAETTLAGSRNIVNGRTYRISYRARWISGCRQLNTRLYFNRLPKTTILDGHARIGTPGTPNSTHVANLGPSCDHLHHDPAVPSPFAPVTVSVTVTDPDGVAAVGLWSRPDGGSWTRQAMVAAPGIPPRYSAVLPGRPAGTVVQFYVEAADALGTVSLMPAAGRDSRTLYQVDDGLARTNGLHNVRLVALKADADELQATINLMSNERIAATLIYDEHEIFYDIGLRLKGSEHSRTTGERLGFNVGFNAAQLFRGVHRSFAIDRSESTGFGQREMLVHQMLNHCGGVPTKYHDLIQVMAPRAAQTGTAELQLARYTDVFLDDQYVNGGDGMLFEYELIYQLNSTDNGSPEGNKVPAPDSFMGIGLGTLGARAVGKEGCRWTFLIKNNEDRDDYSGVIPFCKWMNQSGTAFTSQIDARIDVNQWLRGHAVNVLSGAGDSYGGDGAQHNVQFYVRPPDGRVLYFPHDMDAFFNASRPIVPNADLSRIIAVPAHARTYYGHLLDIMETTYNTNYMARWANHFGKLLPGQPFPSHLAFIGQRKSFVTAQVNAAVPPSTPFAITSNGGADFTTDSGKTTLTGTANLSVASIQVNGITRPVAWTGRTTWSLTVPLAHGANKLNVQAVDRHGNLLNDAVDAVTVTNTGDAGILPIVINEWMADNAAPDGFKDPADGRYQDWIELHNPNPDPVNIGGFTLTDDLAQPGKWPLPVGTTIAPHGFLLIWADNETLQNTPGNGLHAAFQLSSGGESIGLYDRNGTEQHTLTFGPQARNVSQGLLPDGDVRTVLTLPRPTPGAANASASILEIQSIGRSGGGISITWSAVAGRTYQLEFKDALSDPAWSPAGPDITASGSMATAGDATAMDSRPRRFYRVRQVR